MKYVFYNPFSGDGHGQEIAASLGSVYGEDMTLVNTNELDDIAAFSSELDADDDIVICGGDGTINRFVNMVDTDALKCGVYYLPAGTGNDFAMDLGKKDAKEPFAITEYIKNLPTVVINGKTYKFINAVGYGIDGYCCEVGDKKKAAGKQPNYTAIAITGLLFGYKPRNATVIVDGVEHHFKKAWLAPAVFGRFYGGGMMPAPEQSRDSDEISVMLFHGGGRLSTLMAFPAIFKGEHVKSKLVTVLKGKEITVKYDVPAAVQVDGETVVGVSEYTATAPER